MRNEFSTSDITILLAFGYSRYWDSEGRVTNEDGLVIFCGQRYYNSYLDYSYGPPRRLLPQGCRDGSVDLNSITVGIKDGAQ